MTREEFISAAEIAFEKLMTPTRGIPPERMEEPMAKGGRSLKELAAHFSYWNGQIIRALEELRDGMDFVYPFRGDYEAVTAEFREQAASAPLRRVMNDLRLTHSTMIEAVKRLPEEMLQEGEIPAWLIERVIRHYESHIGEVEQWAGRETQKS